MSDSEDQRKSTPQPSSQANLLSASGKEIEQIDTGRPATSRKKKLHRRKLESDDDESDDVKGAENEAGQEAQGADDLEFDDNMDLEAEIEKVRKQLGIEAEGLAAANGRKRDDKATSKVAAKIEKVSEHPSIVSMKRATKRRKGEEMTED